MLQAWCWKWLVEAMTGGGGGGGAGGGGGGGGQPRRKLNMGNEGKPWPVSVKAPISVEITDKPLSPEELGAPLTPPLRNSFSSMDFFSQARKALCLRGPFDGDDVGSTQTPSTSASASASVASTTFLPSALAQLLSKHSDSRKRHKRSHSGTEHKARPEKARGTNIWVETEEYFRDLTVEDIDKLCEVSTLGLSNSDKCFSIPALDNEGNVCNLCSIGDMYNVEIASVQSSGGSDGRLPIRDEDSDIKETGREEDGGIKNKNELQLMDVDIVGEGNEAGKAEEEDEEVGGGGGGEEEEGGGEKSKKDNGFKFDTGSNGLEWLLGSRSKIYLTSERPSKKRKLLGGDAGLEKVLVCHPVEGFSSLCHYCSKGDMGDQLNRLIICSSCGVSVHQRCYGMQDDVDGTWLCSWCKQKKDGQSGDRPCLLCPKQGGALKLAQKTENQGLQVEYAHLFCCQWMPEVYVENIRTMEPIMNIDGINDTQRKLVCYLCKVKFGACVRCSYGACRTSFHPLCAREAKHRMEIWGRRGCDEVELRAFCSKHSEVDNGTSGQCTGDMLVPVGPDSKNQAVKPSADRIHKFGRRNGDKVAVNIEIDDLSVNADKMNNGVLHVDGLSDNRSNSEVQSQLVDLQQHFNNGTSGVEATNDDDVSETMNLNMMVRKLIDQGKVDMKDLAEEFGVSPDSLAPVLKENLAVPGLNGKIVTWLKHHGNVGSLHKTVKVKIKSSTSSMDEDHMSVPVDSNAVTVSRTKIPNVDPIKCIPPRRRTKSDIRILNNDKVMCTSREMIGDDMVLDEMGCGLPNGDGCPSKGSSAGSEKNINEGLECEDISATILPEDEGEPSDAVAIGMYQNGPSKVDAASEHNTAAKYDKKNAKSLVALDCVPNLINSESYTHPLIQHKLIAMNNRVDYGGSREREFSQFGASSSSGICCHRHGQQAAPTDWMTKLSVGNREQLVKARKMGLLELSPSDEVEGELIFFQQRLLSCAISRKHFIDDLISKVAKNLQEEIDAARKKKWDAVLLSQYLYDLREAKKQGRKERRHKEAQAVLAAATAAAAASSRISSLRKDAIEESAHAEDLSKGNFSNGRPGIYSQQNPRVKETISRSAAARLSSEKNSDPFSLASDFAVEHPRTCEICGRCETILNPILVCSSCKVAVHLDCFRGVKSSTGPWYCELCEDLLSSRGSGLPTASAWEKPYFVAECGLCGGTAGAFRRSTNGQWIHAFCAEWVLESTFRRGQVNPVDGMESLSKGGEVCVICSRKQGVCIKCNYGNCQSTFHASCARSTGFYMNSKTIGGKLQHKAYCAKHSQEQKAKADTQKHGMEEFKSLKQVRVELERLRLLCERIIKREKLKRELVVCSQDIIASNRESAVLCALTRHPAYHPDVSSESATTSTRGYTDGNRSGSDTIQRSDDVTVDSTIAGKRHIKFPVSMENDQKTDDSSVSQHFVSQKPVDRVSFSGKKVPHRPGVALRILSEDAEKRSRYRKHPETFEKELVMTSDQASMKNQLLPKGFVYVPIRCLSKEKETLPDACAQEPLEHDG
ncbi:uncharacterized protein [Coffea arabica]|uniref:Uncharacterized protein isoform X3 n=2 Tax=Coffea arabica TaxID=13443 RepID=A0ABM4W111_COFAR